MDGEQLEQERMAIVKRLHGAAGDGRLTLDEVDERIAAARSAQSVMVLNSLVADLGPVSTSYREPDAVTTPVQAEPYPGIGPATAKAKVGSTPEHPLRIQAGWDSVVRRGEWTIPEYLAVSPRLGSIRLDCLLARPVAPVIHLNLSAGAGSVVVIVPSGWAANIDELGHGIGSVNSRVPSEPEPGCPIIYITGSVGVGSFRVRHANWFERRRLRKVVAKRREILR